MRFIARLTSLLGALLLVIMVATPAEAATLAKKRDRAGDVLRKGSVPAASVKAIDLTYAEMFKQANGKHYTFQWRVKKYKAARQHVYTMTLRNSKGVQYKVVAQPAYGTASSWVRINNGAYTCRAKAPVTVKGNYIKVSKLPKKCLPKGKVTLLRATASYNDRGIKASDTIVFNKKLKL